MIATSYGRVAAVDFFSYDAHSNLDFCRVDSTGRQSNKDSAGRALVDHFHFLVKISRVNHPDVVRTRRISWRAANPGLIKEVVAFIENQLLTADVSEAKFQLQLKRSR